MSDHKYMVDIHDIEPRVENLKRAINTLIDRVNSANASQGQARDTVNFFFMEDTYTGDNFTTFQQKYSNMDTIAYHSGQFYFKGEPDREPDMPIVSSKVEGSYGPVWKVTFTMRHPDTDSLIRKQGVMTDHQYKKLCIFVISRSNSTAFLGDFFESGVKPSYR
jgi:hypothetical protein